MLKPFICSLVPRKQNLLRLQKIHEYHLWKMEEYIQKYSDLMTLSYLIDVFNEAQLHTHDI